MRYHTIAGMKTDIKILLFNNNNYKACISDVKSLDINILVSINSLSSKEHLANQVSIWKLNICTLQVRMQYGSLKV